MTAENVSRVPSDLHAYRDRLEAGVEQGRRNRETVQNLTNQIQKMRQRAAENVSLTNSLPQIHVELPPSLNWSDPKQFRDDSPYGTHVSRLDVSPPRRPRNKSVGGRNDHYSSHTTWSADSIPPVRHRSTPRLDYYSDEDREEVEALYSRLKAELMKSSTLEEMNELLREENDAALQANEGLRADVTGLTRALEALESQAKNDTQRFQSENTRYSNQLENQHRQLINLWKAFTAVKRQVREIHSTTANDLDKQKTEFARCAAMMQRAIRQAEHKAQLVKEENTRERDEVVEEVMKKYDAVNANCLQTEHQLLEKNRLLAKAEAELRKTKDMKEELESALERIDAMPELAKVQKRTRSESPATPSAPDVIRRIRATLSAQKESIKTAEDAKERAEAELRKKTKEMETMERENKEKREKSRQRKERDEENEQKMKELERELRRLNDRLAMMMEEKESREKTITQMQENLTATHRSHKEFIEELTSRHREELETRDKIHLEEMEEKAKELEEKRNKGESELQKIRTELEEARRQLRETKAEANTHKRHVDERDLSILNLEDDVNRLRKRLEEETQKADEYAQTVNELSERIDDQLAKETDLHSQLAEAKSLNGVLGDEAKMLEQQMTSMREEISDLTEKLEHSTQNEQELHSRFEANQKEAQDQDAAMRTLRTNVHDLELRLETSVEETRLSREELAMHKDILETKVKELNDIVRNLEEMRREKDTLIDELSLARKQNEALLAQIGALEKELDRRRDEETKNLSLLEDLRKNFDRLTNEGQQKNITIEDLKETIESMKAEEKKREEERAAERIREEETNKMKEREVEETWKELLEKAKEEKKKAGEEAKTFESRLMDLTHLHEKLMEEEGNLRNQLDEAKEALEDVTNKSKKEISHLEMQNNLDREEWDREREQIEKNKTTLVTELRAELTAAEEQLKKAMDREMTLQTEIGELREELEKTEEARKAAIKEQEIRLEDEKTRDQQSDEEKRAQMAKLEELQMKIARAHSQLDEAQRQTAAVERKLGKTEETLNRKSEEASALEEKMAALNEALDILKMDENGIKEKLVQLEMENSDLKASKERTNGQLVEEQKRSGEMSEKLREMKRSEQEARTRSQREREQRMDKEEMLTIASNKIKQLEERLADRQAKADSTADLLRKVEGDGTNMAQALRRERERVTELEQMKEEMDKNLRRLTEELDQTRVALERKTSAGKQATAELLANYKEADRRLVDAQTECEQLRQQLTTISARMERTETKQREAERKVDDANARNSELNRRLYQYERSAKMALNMARSNSDLRPGASYIDIPRASSTGGDHLARATSSYDVSLHDSPQKPVRFDEVKDLDLSSSMEITMRYLKDRIAQLERDKASLTSENENQREETKEVQARMKEMTALLRQMEAKLNELANEKEQLEHRLSNQRHLYLTTEEASRGRENEQKTMRARLATAEMHCREKDSRVAHLQTQLQALRLELSTVDCEKQKIANTLKNKEENARKAEEVRRVLEEEVHRIQKNVREMGEDLRITTKRLEESEADRIRLGKELDDVQKVAKRDRDLLEKLQHDERHWRMTAVNAKKSSEEYHKSIYEERIANLQASYDAAVARNNAIAGEAEKLRQDLREYNQRINTLNMKVADVERRATTEKENKTSLGQQLAVFQRAENEWNRLEKEMGEELKLLRKDKLLLTSEVEDLRRRTVRSDVERKEIDGCRTRLEREVAALKKHLSALEEEKSRTETAVRETLAERKAIDKSLAAMERENSELYKNCGQLQSQIQQLERDSGQRAVTKMLKEQAILESKVAKLIQEKRQLELMIEQKESNYSHKRKLLESQLSLLRDQLEAERRRRLGGGGGSGRFERVTDVRASRTTSVQRQPKGPFREEFWSVVEEFRSRSSTMSNDTSHSIETSL